MRIQGVLDGQLVEIQMIIPQGIDSYIVYKRLGLDTSATDLLVKKKTGTYGADTLSLLTSATVIS